VIDSTESFSPRIGDILGSGSVICLDPLFGVWRTPELFVPIPVTKKNP